MKNRSGQSAAELKAVDYFTLHGERFARARLACKERHHWSPFPDAVASYPDATSARATADIFFQELLGGNYPLQQPGEVARVGEEVSPYTQQPLNILYPQADLDTLFSAATDAVGDWSAATAEQRVGVLMEVIERLYQRVFEIATAVMHTAGQSPNMSYTGSGVNALDRGIEALVYAYEAMNWTPRSARWERQFGRATIQLDKTYRVVPRGVAVCFSCATFPTWNAFPSMMASLATGNAVLVKPHPKAVLPMALSISIFREVLAEAGFDPNLVLLAMDTVANPVGKTIVKHPATAIVDFTGSTAFGKWVEENAHPALCYTETAGVNTVVIESCTDLDAVIRALSTTLCLFSAQMCTSPQNFYIPETGIRITDSAGRTVATVSLPEFEQKLAAAVAALFADPHRAAMLLAAIQSPETINFIGELQCSARVLLQAQPYAHPDFPAARTSTPLMLGVDVSQRTLYLGERFGPVSFVIKCANAQDALAQATGDVREVGGLTAFVYSIDEAFIDQAEQAYARAGAQLTVNLTGPMPLNFAAAYSDFHVTGLNGAGNASLTELGFVAQRFRIVQARRPAQF
jgi:phenylacetic acid degradation protein paaN